MAGIPQNFQSVSNVLANYNFVDIASGTGYITFYAGSTVDLKLLSNSTYYSDTMFETANGAAGAYTLIMDYDFDVLLNRPLDIKGTGIVNLPIYHDPGANTPFIYATVKFRKWDGVTETDISTNDSRVDNAIAGTGYTMLAVDLDCPLTHFKKGETIRLTIMIYAKCLAGVVICKFGHDPMNRTTGWDTTGAVPSRLTFNCPVRLNL